MYQNQIGPFFKKSAPYTQGPSKQKQFGRKELHQDNYEKIRVKSKQNKSQQYYGNEQNIQYQHKTVQNNEEQIEYQYQYNYQAAEQLKYNIEENIVPTPQPANQEYKSESLQQENQEINNSQNQQEQIQKQNESQILEQKQDIEQIQEQVINHELQTNQENTPSNQENHTSNGTTVAEPPQQTAQEKQQINFNPIPQQQNIQSSQQSNYAPITQNRFQPANCPNPFAQPQQLTYPNNNQYNQYPQYPQVIQYIYIPNSNQYCFMSQFQLSQESIEGNYLFLKAQLETLNKHPQ